MDGLARCLDALQLTRLALTFDEPPRSCAASRYVLQAALQQQTHLQQLEQHGCTCIDVDLVPALSASR